MFCEFAPQMVLDYPGYQRPTMTLWTAADAATRPNWQILDAFGPGALMTRGKLDAINAGRPPAEQRAGRGLPGAVRHRCQRHGRRRRRLRPAGHDARLRAAQLPRHHLDHRRLGPERRSGRQGAFRRRRLRRRERADPRARAGVSRARLRRRATSSIWSRTRPARARTRRPTSRPPRARARRPRERQGIKRRAAADDRRHAESGRRRPHDGRDRPQGGVAGDAVPARQAGRRRADAAPPRSRISAPVAESFVLQTRTGRRQYRRRRDLRRRKASAATTARSRCAPRTPKRSRAIHPTARCSPRIWSAGRSCAASASSANAIGDCAVAARSSWRRCIAGRGWSSPLPSGYLKPSSCP